MREALLAGIEKLCKAFPPLKTTIRYSDILEGKEIALFEIIAKYPDEIQQIKEFLKKSTGLIKIKKEDVILVENILASATSNDTSNHKMREKVYFLQKNRKTWWTLHNAYEKIVKNNLIETYSIATAKPPLINRLIPFGNKMHKFQEFHKLFHESIHHILEENGIIFNDEKLDEGLVVCLHKQIMGKTACELHYLGGQGEKYLKNAEIFEKILDKYPKISFIPYIKNASKTDITNL